MLTEMRVDVAVATDTGPYRKTNADALLVDLAAGLVAVSDGIGDTPRSAAAAKIALDAVRELFLPPWSLLPPADRSAREAADRLTLGVMQANGRLYAADRARRLGSTFAGVVVCADALCVGHLGDSRVYLFRPSTRRLARLTEDHTVLCGALRRGVPDDVTAAQPNAQALTRAIGIQRAPHLRLRVTRWAPGDVVLVCTDGVTDWLDDATITRRLVERDELEAVAHRLVERAFLAGSRDNATVVLARWSRSTR